MIQKAKQTWLTRRRMWIILGAGAFLWLAFTAGMTILRYRLNYAPTYDFGLFAQMYYYLDKCLEPLTTCERDGLLSHFAVHLSPIYYLLLPFYKLIPRPETLLFLQALAVISGLVPLVLLCGRLGLSRGYTLVFGLIYCAYPAFMGGCFYDFHENKLLTVIILWTLYFLEAGRFRAMAACAFLILMVKEDAPVYAACIGLYLFLEKKKYAWGGVIFLLSCLYFGAAVWYLNRYGDGAMVNRFSNLISDKNAGLLSMFKTILVNPAYVISQIAVQDKLVFLLQMLLPLGFLPLMTLRWQRWVLLIPLVLINLMSNYPYQHSIFFQYTYGSGAFLFYLAALNFSKLSPPSFPGFKPLLMAASLAMAVSLIFSVAERKDKYLALYFTHRQEAAQARELLGQIPQEASVKSSTFFVAQLSARDEIYLLESSHPAEYIVLDLRKGYETELSRYLNEYRDKGYVPAGQVQGYVLVLKKPG